MSREVRVALESLPEGVALRVEGGNCGLCLVRLGYEVFALDDRCSHQNWPLSDGEVDPAECSIECTKHGSTFSLKDGRPQSLPATLPVATYPVRVEGGEAVVSVP
jgi:3-phenylpropionate/trans-cinnamate dioxygenase ferredoxin component